jgi:hypothetical protein
MIISLDFYGVDLTVKGEYIPATQVLNPAEFSEYPSTEALFDIDRVEYEGKDITELIKSFELALDPLPGNVIFNAIEDSILTVLKTSK